MALEVVGAEISELVVLLNSILTSFCQLLALFVIAIGVSKALFIAILRPIRYTEKERQ